MNKKIFGGIAIVAIAVAVGFNVSISNQKQDKVNMLALANVEQLAYAESTSTSSSYTSTGTKTTSNIECTIYVMVTTLKYVNTSSSSGGSIYGSATVPSPFGIFNLGGSYGGNSSNQDGHWEETTELKVTTIVGSLIGCPGSVKSNCAPYNPCK